MTLLASDVYAACPAAPVGSANDPALQLLTAIDGTSRLGPASSFPANAQGTLVWHDATGTLVACNGTDWLDLRSTLPSDCNNGDRLNHNGNNWECE